MSIKVIINGAMGRMGSLASDAISADPQFHLVARLDKSDDMNIHIKNHRPDVVVDFTVAEVAYENASTIIENGVHPVIGTTGLTEDQVTDLRMRCDAIQLGALVVPNFSIGAVLLMKCATQVIRYFPEAEIIEMHHDGKQDSPSGTAIKTAQMMAQNRQQVPKSLELKETLTGARGAVCEQIPIHAVRLPGLVAHEQVIFGGFGETLTLRHDTIDRGCFMPGLRLACKKVMRLKTLVYGLETILE